MIDIAGKQIIPAVVNYLTKIAKSLNSVREACPEADVSAQRELILEVSGLLSEMKTALTRLQEEAQAASVIESNKERAYAYLEKVTKAMQALRTPADKLEMLVDRELWPLPSYGDMVFEV